MRSLEISAFVLLAVGTSGLLLNEFVFAWGTPVTLLFAVANAVGLVLLFVTYRRRNRDA